MRQSYSVYLRRSRPVGRGVLVCWQRSMAVTLAPVRCRIMCAGESNRCAAMDDEKLLDVVNQSGFPLQIAVEHLVRNTSGPWRVAYTEHAWRSRDDGAEGFIDLVLASTAQSVYLTVECKKAASAVWLFLNP